MKYPLDRICIKSGILCPRCQRLVDSGIVDRYEIPIMKELIDLEERVFKELRKGNYKKAYQSGDLIVIVVEGISDPKALDRAGKELSHRLNAKVKIVERTGDTRRLVEQVVYPATLLGVNSLWLPDGSEQIIIRIYRRDQRFISGKKRHYEDILGQILGKPVRIRLE
ncbi:MAG: transcription elongation factor [Thermoprotei archaeon]|nr:MAG: transcription elongation factor [Thermoprotei archaeon]